MLGEIKELIGSGKRGWNNLNNRNVRSRKNKLEILVQIARSAFDLMNLTLESDESSNKNWQGEGPPPMSPLKKHHLKLMVTIIAARALRGIAVKGGRLYGEEHQLTGLPGEGVINLEPYRASTSGGSEVDLEKGEEIISDPPKLRVVRPDGDESL